MWQQNKSRFARFSDSCCGRRGVFAVCLFSGPAHTWRVIAEYPVLCEEEIGLLKRAQRGDAGGDRQRLTGVAAFRLL